MALNVFLEEENILCIKCVYEPYAQMLDWETENILFDPTHILMSANMLHFHTSTPNSQSSAPIGPSWKILVFLFDKSKLGSIFRQCFPI